MLIDQGALERRERWLGRRPGGWPTSRFPDSVHGVIAARIDLLDAARATRSAAAPSSGAASGRPRSASTRRSIDSLSRRGLVSDSPESAMAGMREFAFKHALTRDVAYSTLPRPERRDLHRQVAEWIQERRARPRTSRRPSSPPTTTARRSRTARTIPRSSAAPSRSLLDGGRGGDSAERTSTRRGAQLERRPGVADDERDRRAAGARRLDVHRGRRWESALEGAGRLLEAQRGPMTPSCARTMLAWRSRVCWLTGRWDEAFSAAATPRWRRSTAFRSRLSSRGRSRGARRSRC